MFIPATDEGEAVAIAAGYVAAGGAASVAMQNSGLGHVLDPLLSLAIPFGIPIALVVSHRGRPGDEELAHHAPMGRITHALLELVGIETVDLGEIAVAEIGERWASRRSAGGSLAVIVRPGVLGACASPALTEGDAAQRRTSGSAEGRRGPHDGPPMHPDGRLEPGHRDHRVDVLTELLDAIGPETVVVGTTGHSSRHLFALADRDRNVYLSGSMGHAAAFGLGVGHRRPDVEVIVIDGDGAALMHLGSLATIAAFAGTTFRHIVLDNAAHATTGGQPTVSTGVSFASLALDLGYAAAASRADFATVAESIAWLRRTPGPVLLHIPTVAEAVPNLPRVGVEPRDQVTRLRQSLGVAPIGAAMLGTAGPVVGDGASDGAGGSTGVEAHRRGGSP